MVSIAQNRPLAITGLATYNVAIKVFGALFVLFVVAMVEHPWLMVGFISGLMAILWLYRQDRLLPVFLMVLTVQWLQAGIAITYAEYLGVSVNDLHGNWFVDDAIVLTSLGVLALGLGIWIPNINVKHLQKRVFDDAINSLNGKSIFVVYLAFLLLNYLTAQSTITIHQISQLLFAASGMKWVAFYLLTLSALVHTRYLGYLCIAVLIEVVVGSLGFFSQFRTAFILVLIAVMTNRQKISSKLVIVGVATFIILATLMVAWTSVKENYRAFVNQGSRQQVVLVPAAERLTMLASMTSALTSDDLQVGMTELLERLSYVEYFSHVLRNVPSGVPHQEGALLAAAVGHVFKPRVFFPDKRSLPSDTLITEKYTQLRIVNQASRHTNIPIGYIGEAYIDYGYKGVVIVTLCIGLLIGLLHRVILSAGKTGLLYASALTVSSLSIMLLETSLPKIIGGYLSSLVVLVTIVFFTKGYLISYLWIPSKKSS